jgi:ABC-type cobalamin transport system permease subunit
MKTTVSKIAVFVLAVGAIFWLGGINIRAIIGNELLEPGTLNLRQGLPLDAERTLFDLLARSSILTIISYVVVFMSSIIYLVTTSLKFKENGWLLMVAILFYVFTPVEIYTTYLDTKSLHLWFFSSPSLQELRELFVKRIGALSGLPVIALLCYYTIIGLIVWRPLKKKSRDAVQRRVDDTIGGSTTRNS